MARAYKCDRCGRFYESKKEEELGEYMVSYVACKTKGGEYTSTRFCDLCEKCMESLNDFMAGGEMDE